MIRPTICKRFPYGARQFSQLPALYKWRSRESFLPGFSGGVDKVPITRYHSRNPNQDPPTATDLKPGTRKIFRISEEVKEAVTNTRPVVALETTIYTHGFPYPDNVALAMELEAIVRKNGGVPATIGVLDGVIRVGLSSDEISHLASAAGSPDTMKVSRRDVPYIAGIGLAGRKLNGGTTVAGTMMIAKAAGISVFGTGGLGGVHRGGQDTMDISADLTELGRTPVAVISSGCKSFLDLPRTLEYLETQGVSVCTFADGRTGDIDLPSFYSRESGIKSPLVVQNAKEAAAIFHAGSLMKIQSGMLFANPLPEEFSIPKADMDIAIDQAVREATEQGFHGHANTPFILSRIKELTQGNSIVANRALIQSNVAIATQVAVELSRLRGGIIDTSMPDFRDAETPSKTWTDNDKTNDDKTIKSKATKQDFENADISVFGSVAVDISCNYSPHTVSTSDKSTSLPTDPASSITPHMKTSNIASITQTIGGVGLNVATAAHLVASKLNVRLCSLVSQDIAGVRILSTLQKSIDTRGLSNLPIRREDGNTNRTAQYVAVNDGHKDLFLGMADMSIYEDVNIRDDTKRQEWMRRVSKGSKWSVIDANWNSPTIRFIMASLRATYPCTTKIAFEPVSVPKSTRLFQPISSTESAINVRPFPNNMVDLATPNQYELAAMHASAKQHEYFESDEWWKVIDSLGIPSSGARDRFVALTSSKITDEGIPLQSIQLLPFIPTILTKLGPQGVLMTELLKPGDPRLKNPDSARYILSRNANRGTEVGGVYMRLFPAIEHVNNITSVNGVGDTFLGVAIAGLASGVKLDKPLIDLAQKAAVLSLKSIESVSPEVAKLKQELKALKR